MNLKKNTWAHINRTERPYSYFNMRSILIYRTETTTKN